MLKPIIIDDGNSLTREIGVNLAQSCLPNLGLIAAILKANPAEIIAETIKQTAKNLIKDSFKEKEDN